MGAIILAVLFSLAILLYLIIGTYSQRWYVYAKYSKIRAEWKHLAKDLNLDTNINDGNRLRDWLKGFEPHIKGPIQGFFLNIYLSKPKGMKPAILVCEIHLKNSNSFNFTITSKINGNTTDGTNIETKNVLFDERYNLITNDANKLKWVLNQEITTKIIKAFSVNMLGAVSLINREIEVDESVLDSETSSNLFYAEQSLLITEKIERLSIKKRITVLLEIAKKLDI